jgi:hypothetical protein
VFRVRDASGIEADMLLSIDQEILSVSDVSGNEITVVRAFDGTTAAPHSNGLIEARVDAWHHNALADEVQAIQATLGTNLSTITATITGAMLVSTRFKFAAQTPGGSLVVGLNTITLTPVPAGVNAANADHFLYISAGTGTAEACEIVGGTAVAGASSGTVIVSCANTHSGAWTIQSATAGIQEAIYSQADASEIRVTERTPTLYAPVTSPTGWKISGSCIGDASTRFQVATSFGLSHTGVFIGATTAYFCAYENFSVEFTQPDSTNRATYTAWPPAFYLQGNARFVVRNVAVYRAWNGIDARGNSGGGYIENFWSSAFHFGIQLDGALDTVRVLGFHHWPFGLTANQATAFDHVDCWAGQFGQVDDLHISQAMVISGSGFRFYLGAGGGSNAKITSTDFDGHAGLLVQAGIVTISNSMFTMATTSPGPALAQNGGVLLLDTCYFFNTSTVYPCIDLNFTAVGYNVFKLANSYLQQSDPDADKAPVIRASAGAGGYGDVAITGNRFAVTPGVAFTLPTVSIDSGAGNVRATITGNTSNDKGAGAAKWLIIGQDGNHTVLGNQCPGWGVTFPTGIVPDVGLYSNGPAFRSIVVGDDTAAAPFRLRSPDSLKVKGYRVTNAGKLEILNSALSSVIYSLSDTGVITAVIPEYADNAAALAGGLVAGNPYRTGDAAKWVH